MGTLGCIHDMQRRDRENRELLQRSRERMRDTRWKMMQTTCRTQSSDLTVEEWSAIESSIAREEALRKKRLLRMKFALLTLLSAVVGGLVYLFIR